MTARDIKGGEGGSGKGLAACCTSRVLHQTHGLAKSLTRSRPQLAQDPIQGTNELLDQWLGHSFIKREASEQKLERGGGTKLMQPLTT